MAVAVDDGSLVSLAEVPPAVVVAPGRFDLCCNFKRRCFMYNNCSSSAAASDLSCVGLYGEINAFCGGLVDVRLEMSVSGVFIIVEVTSKCRQQQLFKTGPVALPPQPQVDSSYPNRKVEDFRDFNGSMVKSWKL